MYTQETPVLANLRDIDGQPTGYTFGFAPDRQYFEVKSPDGEVEIAAWMEVGHNGRPVIRFYPQGQDETVANLQAEPGGVRVTASYFSTRTRESLVDSVLFRVPYQDESPIEIQIIRNQDAG